MTVNRELAEQRGLSEYQIQEIDRLHEHLDRTMDYFIEQGWTQAREDEIHDIEYLLQQAWCFPKDCGYHRYAHQYAFVCQWYGRTFKCVETGNKITLGKDVQERQYIPFGNCAIDLGILNGYSRFIGNIEEIKK